MPVGCRSRTGSRSGDVSAVKAFASALTIGSGGSVGREGPIVQIGSALGSTLGRVMTGLPVLAGEHQMTGWITHQSVLSALAPARASR